MGFILCAGIAVLAVQVQQRVYRHQVDRLIADLNTLELHKSTWADAERLMHSWGRWGHYDGTCTAVSCRYDIWLEDASFHWPNPHWEWAEWVFYHAFPIYESLGGQSSRVEAFFLVEDGFVVRNGLHAALDVPPERKSGEAHGYELLVEAVSLPRLARLGEPGGFETNPYYNAVRPGGCMICRQATLAYSDHAPAGEVRRATAIDTSCLVGRSHCRTVEDLLPATEPFHLYDEHPYARSAPSPPRADPAAHACAIPLWVRGRDASDLVVVEVLQVNLLSRNQGGEVERYMQAKVKVLASLRGRLQTGATLDVEPFQPTPWSLELKRSWSRVDGTFCLGSSSSTLDAICLPGYGCFVAASFRRVLSQKVNCGADWRWTMRFVARSYRTFLTEAVADCPHRRRVAAGALAWRRHRTPWLNPGPTRRGPG